MTGGVVAVTAAVLLMTACNPTVPRTSTVRSLHLGGDGGHIYTASADGVLQVRVTASTCQNVRAVVSVNWVDANPFGWPTVWKPGTNNTFTNVAYASEGYRTGFWLWTDDPTPCTATYEARLVQHLDHTQIVGDLRCDTYC